MAFVEQSPLWFQSTLVGVSAFLVYAPTAWFGPRQNNDTWAAALSAWRLGQHGELDLSGYDAGIPWSVEVGDQVFTNRFPGVIFAAAPFYAIFGRSELPTIFPGAIAAAALTATAVAVGFAVFRSLVSPRAALGATAIFAFATPTWSVSADALWTHGPGQMWLLLGMLALSRNRHGTAGAMAAIGTLTRPHTMVGWAVAAMYDVWASRTVGRAARLLIAASAGAVLLVAYNALVFDRVGILGGYTSEHLSAAGVGPLVLLVNVLGSLVSPHRGILLLTPFLWLLLPGLPAAWREAPTWVRASALGGLAYGAVQLYLIRFIGGHGFYSYRTLIESLTFLAPLLLLSFKAWTGRTWIRRMFFSVLVLISGSFHAFGAILDRHQLESGNPFREFSGFNVATQVGPWVTTVWILSTIAACVVIVLRYYTRPRRISVHDATSSTNVG